MQKLSNKGRIILDDNVPVDVSRGLWSISSLVQTKPYCFKNSITKIFLAHSFAIKSYEKGFDKWMNDWSIPYSPFQSQNRLNE